MQITKGKPSLPSRILQCARLKTKRVKSARCMIEAWSCLVLQAEEVIRVGIRISNQACVSECDPMEKSNSRSEFVYHN